MGGFGISSSGKPTYTQLNSVISEDADSIITRPSNYESEVAMGLWDGKTTVNKWGRNLAVGATSVLVSSFSTTAFNPLTDIITTAQTITITYDNTTDGAGTTGAVTLIFTYIGEDYLSYTAYHTLGNTGTDITEFTTLGINRVVALCNGTVSNVNAITCTATVDTTVQAQIPAGTGVTQQAIFHTQIGHNFLVDWIFLNSLRDAGGGSDPKVTFKIYSWSRVVNSRFDVLEYRIDTSRSEEKEFNLTQKFPFGGREVVWIEAVSTRTGTFTSARFSGVEERVP